MFFKKKRFIVLFTLFLCLAVSAALGENTLRMPGMLTEIEAEAFYGNASLDSVILPEGIKRIGDLAFANSSVGKINLPASLEYISKNAFDGCVNFAPSAIEGTYAFEWCRENNFIADTTEIPETPIECFTWEAINDLEASITGYIGSDTIVRIPEFVEELTITFIGNSAFADNNTLSTVYFPDTIKIIDSYAFDNCRNLTSVDFGSGLIEVGASAFQNCVNLETIILPEGIKTINPFAFENCISFTKIQLPNSITDIGMYAFGNCINLEIVNIPLNWEKTLISGKIESGIFVGCKKLTSINIPEGMENLPANAFYDCIYLEEVTLPSTLVSIGDSAFRGCTGISSIDIPEGLREIWGSAFKDCINLETIELPEGIYAIYGYVFDNCTGFTNIRLPDNLTIIGECAFSNCINLESINIPLNWNNASGMAHFKGIFVGCKKLTSITIPEGMENLPGNAFYDCIYLKEVILPSTLISIGYNAFRGCTGISSIDIPEGLKEIGAHAFRDCTNLKTIELPEGIQTIELNAFYNCTSFTNIQLPDSIVGIGQHAFGDCINLEKINIPLKWEINLNLYNCKGIFTGCKKLTSITIPEGMERIPTSAFGDCTYLENISLPSTLKTIGDYAFIGCTGIINIDIPSGVEEVGSSTFSDCTNLKKIYVPVSVSSIGDYCFDNCPELKIYCEYGSVALQHAMDNSIPYYYLSMTGAQYPSGTLYQGDPFNFYGYVLSSENISSITASIYSVEQGKNIMSASLSPNTKEANLYQFIQQQFTLEKLPCGEYIYTIGATAGEETETFTYSRFEIVPPPLRINTNIVSSPLGYITQGTRRVLDGTISANYVINTAEISIYNGYTGEIIQNCVIYPNAYSFNISAAAGTINTSLLDSGKHLFIVRVTSNEERATAHKNVFYITTPTQKEARIRDFDKVFETSSISNGDRALCTESVIISDAAYSVDDVEDNLKDLGFSDIETSRYSSGADTVGHAIGWKNVLDENGNSTRLLAVVCRGSGGLNEWLSNFSFTLTDNGFHGGFYRASQDVLASLYRYINEYFSGTNLSDYKIWVTGHSRGGAVANILAGYLLPNAACDDNNIYAYTFACPSVSVSELPTKQNIRNFNIGGDLVPRLPMASWGFKRYGWTVTYPNEVNEIDQGLIPMKHMDQIEGMLYQLTGDRYAQITQRLYDKLTGKSNINLYDYMLAFVDAAYFVLPKGSPIQSAQEFYEGLIALGFNAGNIAQTHICSTYVTWIENWR